MNLNILSQISLINADQIFPFEWFDNSGCANTDNLDLSDINLIRHPFIVTELDDGSYLLLDRIDEFAPLLAAGLDCFPVQVCRPEQLDIRPVRLGLVNFSYDEVIKLAGRHPDQIQVEPGFTGTDRGSFVPVVFAASGETSRTVWLRHSSQAGCPLPLDYLFRAIVQKGRYLPIIERRSNGAGVTKTVSLAGTLSLPTFELEDLIVAARADRLFPPNILKVLPHCRVLNIDFPMSVLTSDMPLEEKKGFLNELITLREQSSRTSFFEGQVYLLNR